RVTLTPVTTTRRTQRSRRASRVRRARWRLAVVLVPLGLATLVGAVLLWPPRHAASLGPALLGPGQHIYAAQVTKGTALQCQDGGGAAATARPTCGEADVRLAAGPDRGASFVVQLPQETFLAHLPVGSTVKVIRIPAAAGVPTSYQFLDTDRTVPL